MQMIPIFRGVTVPEDLLIVKICTAKKKIVSFTIVLSPFLFLDGNASPWRLH